MRAFARFPLELDESLTHNLVPSLKLSNNFSAIGMYFASKPASLKFELWREIIKVKALSSAKVKFFKS